MPTSRPLTSDEQLIAPDGERQDARVVRRLAAATSTTAFACGACCALAFFIPAVSLGVFGGIVAWLAKAHPVVSAVAVAAVFGGWLWIAVQSVRTGRRPTRATLLVMAFATVMTALAYILPTTAVMPAMPGM